LYSVSPSDFHDIIVGANPFPARVGYDLATGLGTPIANKLIPDLMTFGSSSAQSGLFSMPASVYGSSVMSPAIITQMSFVPSSLTIPSNHDSLAATAAVPSAEQTVLGRTFPFFGSFTDAPMQGQQTTGLESPTKLVTTDHVSSENKIVDDWLIDFGSP
jgi:hypothetical protein